MVDLIKISCHGSDAAAAFLDDSRNDVYFEYLPSYIRDGADLSPLQMPLSRSGNRIYSFPHLNSHLFFGLPGLLADALPAGFSNEVMDYRLLLNGVNPVTVSPIGRLCLMGNSAPGALAFEPAGSTEAGVDMTSEFENRRSIDLPKLNDLVRLLLTEKDPHTILEANRNEFDDLAAICIPSGNRHPSAVVAFNEETEEIRGGIESVEEGFTPWILNFNPLPEEAGTVAGFPAESPVINKDTGSGSELNVPGGGRATYACYLMALDCGIKMMKGRLLETEDEAFFLMRRFDRTESFQKIHTQSLFALAHLDYSAPGGTPIEKIFSVMRQLEMPHPEAVQLYRRVVFNILTFNTFSDSKNISLQQGTDGRWRLAPAYDVIHACGHSIPANSTGLHRVSVNRKTDNIELADLVFLAEQISLKRGREIIEDIVDTVSHWHLYADEAGMSEEQAKIAGKGFRTDYLASGSDRS